MGQKIIFDNYYQGCTYNFSVGFTFNCAIVTNNCYDCTSYTTCTQCDSGFYLYTNQCFAFPLHCAVVTGNQCTTCSSGYALVSGACSSCSSLFGSSCTSCSSTACSCAQTQAPDSTGRCQICASFPLLTACQTCTSNTTCASCIPTSTTYALNSVTHTCQLCSGSISNCVTCSSLTSCTSCVAGYAPNSSGQCSLCSVFAAIPNCQLCTDNNTCTSCSSNAYVLDSLNKCTACSFYMPNCQTCSSSTVCLTCSTEYAINSINQCASCSSFLGMSNCQLCSDASTCTSCVSNSYGIDPVTKNCRLCSDFQTNCLTCSSSTMCTSCAPASGYAVDSFSNCVLCSTFTLLANCLYCSNNNTCTACSSTSYALNFINQCQLCSVTLTNCTTCSSTSVCTGCDTGYALNSTNKCLPCGNFITNCATCSSNSTCTSCSGLNILKSNLCRLCAQIVPNCISCNSVGDCLTCSTGYGLQTTPSSACPLCSVGVTNCLECVNQGDCSKCVDTHYVGQVSTGGGAQNVCQPCSTMSNCLKCSSSSACTQCTLNFALNTSDLCQACSVLISGCQMCVDRFVCTGCGSGYAIDASSSCQTCSYFIQQCINCINNATCTSCNPGFIVDAGTCKSCGSYMPDCLLCTNSNTCTSCNAGFALDSTAKCKACSLFIPNCATCSSNNTCTSCVAGYALSSNQCKLCSVIFPHCSWCTSNSSCSICDIGYALDGGQCYPCNKFIPHCNECSSKTTCTLCYDPYDVDSNSKCQKCKLPLFYVSDICHDDEHCLSAFKNKSNLIECSLCNFNKKYTLNESKRCVCSKGFHDVGNGCEQICGDGLILTTQCDDNNTQDWDGCSSKCNIQKDFVCQRKLSGVSKCKLNKAMVLKIDYVQKIISQNKALIYISLDSIEPHIQHFYRSMLFSYNVMSNRSQTIVMLGSSMNQYGQIVIEVEYNQTIEDSRMMLNFSFPKENMLSQDCIIRFQLRGSNYALIVSGFIDRYEQIYNIQVYIVICFYVFVIAFLISEKFIAVEALNTLQMIYFSLLLIYLNGDWPQAFSTVLPLKYSMGFNQLIHEEKSFTNLEDLTFNKYRYLGMAESFLMNNMTNSLILTVLAIIFLTMYFVKTKMETAEFKTQDSIEKRRIKRFLRRFRKIFKKFHNITFHFSYIMIFQIIVSLFIETSFMKSLDKSMLVLSKLTAMWTFVILIFTILENFNHFFLKVQDTVVEQFRVGMVEARYKAIFLSYVLFNALCICLLNDKVFYGFSISVILLLLAVIYLFFVIIYRPYRYSFSVHGFTLIVNQLIFIITLGLISIVNFGIKLEEFYLLGFCYTLLGFCIIVVLLTILRVYLDFRFGAKQVQEEMEKEVKKIEELEKNSFVKKKEKKIQSKQNDTKNEQNQGNDSNKQLIQNQNPYSYQNQALQQEQIDFLNELISKKFLSQFQRDQAYYRIYKQKPLKWVQQNQKQVKYEYLLQKEKQQFENNIYKQEMKKKKDEKAADKNAQEELKMIKDKLRKEYYVKKNVQDKKELEKKRKKKPDKSI